MWGNGLGWFLSAVVALATVIAIYVFGRTAVPDPTPKFLSILQPIELPISPDRLVAMDQPCDAGDAYRDAMNEYNKDPSLYNGSGAPSASVLPAVQDVLKATHCKNITLFAKDPSELINYHDTQPPLQAIEDIGNATMNQGLVLRNNKKPDEAEKYFDAAFALGAKLFAERVTYRELEAGEGLMSGASKEMADLAEQNKDAQRAQLCLDFNAKYRTFDGDHIQQMLMLIATIDARVERQEAGDVFYLAEKRSNKVDHMWQIEAIRTLGRYRFEDVGEEPQRQANIALHRLLKDDKDPQVQAAAKLASDLTIDSFHQVGG